MASPHLEGLKRLINKLSSLPDIPDIVVVVVAISMAQPCQVVGLVVVAGGTGA